MSSSGELITQVYTSRAQIPISGAIVAITQPREEGTYHLVALRTTNQSGRTPQVELPTPAPLESVTPEGDHPFATYDVWVQMAGYEIQQIEQVQIFPEITTIQKVELIPLPEHTPLRSRGVQVVIPPQDL